MLLRVFAIAILSFAAIVAYMIGTRIDQETISLLSGTLIGILVTSPCAALITYILVRRRDQNHMSSYERASRSNVPLPQNPPQYWVMPQMPALSNASLMQAALNAGSAVSGWPGTPDSRYLPRPQRRFYVIGENGETKTMDGEPTLNDEYEMEPGESGAAF